MERITALVAPLACLRCEAEGIALCSDCIASLTGAYHMNVHGLERVQYVSPYQGEAQEIVRLLKFERVRSVAEQLATAMCIFDIPPDALLVPAVTAPLRVRQRGYDQAVLIAQSLSRRTGLPVVNVLVRQNAVRQLGASRVQRIAQAHNLYAVYKPSHVTGRHIILVDDVVTTGATLQAAARVLYGAGASSVEALVFARAE